MSLFLYPANMILIISKNEVGTILNIHPRLVL